MEDEKIVIDVVEPKEGFFSRHKKTIALILSCCILSTGFGFAGAGLAMHFLAVDDKSVKNTEVLYQSVVQTNAEGEAVGNMSVADIAANVKDSVVEITTSKVVTSTFLQQFVASGAGSGVIITADGLIVTNHHVVDGATSITVRLSDGNEYEATLIGSDAKNDLAVIRIEATDLKPVIMGNSDNVVIGEPVVAVGNPLGSLGGSVTDGIISALDREITIGGQEMTLLQTNVAINPGNSGGGLFNGRGELIGIVNAKSMQTSDGNAVEGIGFAIPVDIVKEISEKLITTGSTNSNLSLGISIVEISDIRAALTYGVNTMGLYVNEVMPDSNAEKGGLQQGDIIIAADDEQITRSDELKAVLNAHEAGDTLRLTVVRDKRYVDLDIVLNASEQKN